MAIKSFNELFADGPVDEPYEPPKPDLRDTFNDLAGRVTATSALGRNVTQNGAVVGAAAAVNYPAFNAAADAEVANGTKTLYVNGGNYNIAGSTLDKIHSVFLIGTGSVSGVYRKQVFNPMTPGPADCYAEDIIPAAQLRKLNSAYERTGIINVVLWGDSIATYKPGPNSARMDLKVEAYRAHLLKMFPKATVNFYNRSIGGKRYADWNQVDAADPTNYTWYVPSTTWSSHIAALNPDLVILAFGMNRSESIQELVAPRTYLTGLGTCDVLWETNMSPNLAWDGYTQASLEALDREAGMTRSYARYIGDGIIDFHRRCCVARDGLDIRMAHSVQGTKETIPAVSNQSIGTQFAWNWKVTAHFDASSWANGATTALQVITGAANDYLSITKSAGGFWAFVFVCGGTTAYIGPATTSAAAASSSATAQLTVEIRDDVLTVYTKEGQAPVVSEEPIYSTKIVRKTSYAQPYIQIALPGSVSLTSADFVYAEQRRNMPLITNKDLWDSTYYTVDGGINHPSSAGSETIYMPVLQQLNFRAPTGILFHQGPLVVTPNTTTETTLTSKVIAAGQFAPSIRGSIKAEVVFAATANAKTVRVKFGGSTIYTYTGSPSGGSVEIDIDFAITTDNFTYIWGRAYTPAGVVQISTALANSVWASATTFSITGQNGTGGLTNEIVMRQCLFDILPKAA